jgi:hypothetical protein
MLFVLAVMLCPAGLVRAEDVPEEELPELFNDSAQTAVFDVGLVNLTEEPEPDNGDGDGDSDDEDDGDGLCE